MLKLFPFVLFIFSCFAQAETLVRVRLFSIDNSSLKKIQVTGLGVVFEADKNGYRKVGIPSLNHFQISYKDSSWKIIDKEFEKTIQAPYLAIEGTLLRIQSEYVPEKIFLWANPRGIDVVGVLKLEDYLMGVLPHEMPASWELEALKAQAVVARSFTYVKILERKKDPFHLDSTVNDQVYKNPIYLDSKYLTKIKDVLKETENLVLKDNSGNTKRALYHADCGGRTEKSSHVWGAKDVEFSVSDPFCPNGQYASWTYIDTQQTFLKKISNHFKNSLPLGTEFELSKEKSGRISFFRIKNTDHKISAQELRKLIGYGKIKSTFFDFHHDDYKVYFKGRGFGHGVGMCQWGSQNWAKRGKDYKAILKHYFPHYKIAKL